MQEKYAAALIAWEDSFDEDGLHPEYIEPPHETEFLSPQMLEFGVGSLGSVWFDTELEGFVDGASVTRMTRVTLHSSAGPVQPYRITIDPSDDAPF